MRRAAKAYLAVVATSLLAILAISSPAQAHLSHLPAEPPTIDGAQVPNGGFGGLGGMAVDAGDSSLYVIDPSGAHEPEFGGAVHHFDSAGVFQAPQLTGTATSPGGFSLYEGSDVAVDETNQTVYVTDTFNNQIDAFDPSDGSLKTSFDSDGQLLGSSIPIGQNPEATFSSPCGLAVDPANGNLYVADSGHNRIWIFDDSGAYLGRIADSALNGPCGIALNSAGDLFVRDANDGKVLRFNRTGAAEYVFASTVYAPEGEPGANDIAIDSSNDHLYIDKGDRITEYDHEGNQVTTFGQGVVFGSTGIAVDPTSGKVYASESGTLHVFGPLLTLADVNTGQASDVTSTTATLKGTIDAAGGADAQCSFEYDTAASFEASGAYAQSAACNPTGPFSAAEGTQEVSASLTGLDKGTTYRFRIAARNPDPSFGADQSFTTVGLPVIASASVSEVTSGSARLSASINPTGGASSYRFEYVTETEFQANGFANAAKVPVPDGAIAAGSNPVSVSQKVSGLSPDTAYRYRAIASNGAGTSEGDPKSLHTAALPMVEPPDSCPNAAIRAVQHSAFLPNCRAYEMVSPQEKNGADISATTERTHAAADGSATTFSSLVAFGDAIGTGVLTEYLAQRSDEPDPGNQGWSTHSITPANNGGSFETYSAVLEPIYPRELSPDLDSGVVFTRAPQTDDPNVAGVVNLYLRTDLRTPGKGSYQLVTRCPLCEQTGTPLPPLPATAGPAGDLRPVLAWSSPDLGRILFESRQPLTADATANGQPKVYEWDHGTVRLASLIPPAGETRCGYPGGPACETADISIAGTGAGANRQPGLTPHTLSDGSDGHSRAFFTRPTSDGVNSNISLFFGNLYMRLDNTETVQLNASERSPGEPPSEFSAAAFWDASPDGTRAFFSTGQQLTDDAAANFGKLYMYDATKAPGEANLTLIDAKNGDLQGLVGLGGQGHYAYFNQGEQLYLWHDGAITSIGPVAPAAETFTALANQVLNPRQVRLSADGKHLLFSAISGAGLTGYDQDGPCVTPAGLGCRELYLYNADTDALRCVSCSPSGATATVNAATSVREGISAAGTGGHENRAISADGRYAFFSSAEALVPQDTNGKSDAYEYDSVSEKLHLLSSGTDPADSYFLDASADGSNAFILTRQQLVGWDSDGALDVYDVRTDGGFPEPPSAAAAACSGDVCQGASSAAPPPSANGTSVVAGPANPKARHGKAKKRCAKSQRKAKSSASKSARARCVKKKNTKHSHKRDADHNRRAGR